jgi:hypothetical protein
MFIHGDSFEEYSNGMKTGRIKEEDPLHVVYKDNKHLNKSFERFYALTDKEIRNGRGHTQSAEEVLDNNPWIVIV